MVSISWYLSENVRVEMSKTQHFEKFEKVICSELAAKVYIYICIYTDMGTGRKRRENKKTQNMVSISWYLSEKVRVEMSKTQHFGKFEKVILSELAAKYIFIYIYICIYTDMGTGRKRRENEDYSWTMESLPTRYPTGRGSTAGMATDIHDWATMETKIIRGRWDPSRQGALPVEVPLLEWLPTCSGHDGNEDHSWTMEPSSRHGSGSRLPALPCRAPCSK